MGKGYGQYCPIARASEIVCERWTPLVLRELMSGSCHFNEISRGVPLMSRALLIKRLKELEAAGMIARQANPAGQGWIYLLTPAGEALRPVIESLGTWAAQWTCDRIFPDQLDDQLLMWSMRRSVNLQAIPPHKLVLQFDLRGLVRGKLKDRSYWMVIDQEQVDVCLSDPGFEVDVVIHADLSAFTHVVMGYDPLDQALEAGSITFEGPQDYVRQLPVWLYLQGERRYLSGLAPAVAGKMT
ncbi:winged helix-turn-helix transcriptional regulator [Lyngbya confervoides]|uniref:Winged helix-turn-helix transcriptional regulator n=1 Tax=Lyngbya confervoides BDU141951 TaxID=1574623 RepID=A0ABD4T2R9_9CYAN|nr:winged helix-turn-helix transcriptional regulator [Lyngbya confervoides]MCM1982921.1 winged helix-turn-helix transcriptional regulator [Lyngbya confervoides BDU141951]